MRACLVIVLENRKWFSNLENMFSIENSLFRICFINIFLEEISSIFSCFFSEYSEQLYGE